MAETQITRKLGKLNITETNGDEVHLKLFEKKELKTPAYWKQII